jgi:hypothetical protein
MAARQITGWALAGAVLAGTAGCSSADDESAQPATVDFPEVGLRVDVPPEMADLTYAMGTSEEGQPALYFSTRQLASVGGASCSAGARSAVSPYPLGQIVVSDETPEHVREEARQNPEANLGTFVKQVGEIYLYYVAPPKEPCVTGNSEAAALQRAQTGTLRPALSTIRETE